MLCRDTMVSERPSATDGTNHRQHVRKPLAAAYTQVTVSRGDGAGDSLIGHAYDLSLGGVRFELDEALNVAEPVEIELRLPGRFDQPIRAQGVCVRYHEEGEVGPVRMGVRFTDWPSRIDRTALADFMQTIASA